MFLLIIFRQNWKYSYIRIWKMKASSLPIQQFTSKTIELTCIVMYLFLLDFCHLRKKRTKKKRFFGTMYNVYSFDYWYIFATLGSVIVNLWSFSLSSFELKERNCLLLKKGCFFFSSFFSTYFPNVLLSSKWMVGIVNSRMASFKIDRQTNRQTGGLWHREITDLFGSWRKYT